MKRVSVAVVILILGIGGYTAAGALSQAAAPSVVTETLTHVYSYTVPTETETVTETQTVTVTETNPPPPPPPPPPSPPPPPPPAGTVIERTNQTWTCDAPVSSLGTRPIRVILHYTVNFVGQAFRLGPNCVGAGDGSLDFDISIEGDGQTHGPMDDAIRVMNASPGARNLRITGKVNCGRNSRGFHQDGIQAIGGSDITFVDLEIGEYAAGKATCQGAGGIMFYSGAGAVSPVRVNVEGGSFIGCNHSLNGNSDGDGGHVSNAHFRSGNTGPECAGYANSHPCTPPPSVTFSGLVCERLVGGAWVPVSPQ